MTHELDRRKPYVVTMTIYPGKTVLGNDAARLPMVGIDAHILKEGRETSLFYFDIGCSRGHLLSGKIKKELKNGITFYAKNASRDITLTELTMEEFEQRVRPHLEPVDSEMLHDLDDVYTWYRQMVEMT
jgi:hypothetical protein